MRIAVYSGSFDPLHKGHEAIMRQVSGEGLADWVYLVVSPQNPFKDPSKAENAAERYRAAVRAVSRHPDLRVWVDPIELSMDPPQYTIRTLDALRLREPGVEFVLVIGADNLASMRGWRDYGRLLLEYGVLVFPRGGFDCPALREDLLRENPQYRITLVQAPLVDVSSTQIREALARGEDAGSMLM